MHIFFKFVTKRFVDLLIVVCWKEVLSGEEERLVQNNRWLVKDKFELGLLLNNVPVLMRLFLGSGIAEF